MWQRMGTMIAGMGLSLFLVWGCVWENTLSASENAVPDEITIDELDFKDMELTDALKMIAEKTGFNIVAGREVQGRVTASLKKVKLKEALWTILDTNGLAYQFEEGVARIMSAKEYEDRYGRKFGGKEAERIVHLHYAEAETLAAVLNQMPGPSSKIVADNRANILFVTTTPQRLDLIEKMVAELDVPVETRVFVLNYAEVKEISQKVEAMLTRNLGRLKFDERSNKLVVTDTPRRLEDIKTLIAAFDVAQGQVLIEARIVQVALSAQHKFGIDWEAIVRKFHDINLISNFSLLRTSPKKATVSVGTLADDNYAALLEALESVGETNILASPRITSLNNQEAKILVGSTEPYVTSTTTTSASGPATISESVNFIEVGVKLRVTPTIHRDGFITMKIRPEVSSVTGAVTTANNNTIPVVESSEAEATVMVKDGATVVIGGLIKEETNSTVHKVPILGSVPVLGAAFRSTDRLKRKTEIVIFLTPRLTSGDPGRDAAEKNSQNH